MAQPSWPKFKPPENRLPEAPEITTCEQADLALFELSFLNWYEGQVQAVVDQRCAVIKEDALQELRAQDVDTKARREQLVAALQTFGQEHRSVVLEGQRGKKRDLSHGVLQFKVSPAKIDLQDEHTDHDVLEGIKTKCGWLNALTEWLEGLMVGAVRLASIGRVELRIDKTKTLKAYQEKTISTQQLEALGLRYVEPVELFSATPRDYVVAN